MESIENYGQLLKTYQNQLAEFQGVGATTAKEAEGSQGESFDSFFSTALDSLEEKVSQTQQNTTGLITGDLDNIHSLMIDMSEAQLTLQTAVQVRNKCIDAYNEIKNMQF